jgi:CheY-specific phosphatase CheX
MAVKLGIMTNEQVTQVLTLQKNSHVYIGEALVKVGGLSSEDIQRYLEEFKVDQAPYATDRVAIPPGLLHPEIWEAFADLTQKMLTRVVGISCRLGKCRLDDHLQGSDVTAAMDLSGDVTARVILSVSTNIQEKIAGAILKEENLAGESTEVLNDTVMEFLNIVCGNLAAKVAQLGKNLEILPPLIIQSENNLIAVPVGSQGLLFDLHPAGHEKIEIAVFVQR